MPQNPLAATVAINSSKAQTPLKTDSAGNLLVSNVDNVAFSRLNITSTATIVLATQAGKLGTVNVVAGGKLGNIYDVAKASQVSAGHLITTVASPSRGFVGNYNFPFFNGLTVVAGSGQKLAASWTL